MSWFNVRLLPALLLPMLVGACSFTPVYQDGSAATRLELAYATPDSRLEQVIYQELADTLGASDDARAPLVSVTVSSDGEALARSDTDNPNDLRQVTVTARATISYRDGSNRRSVSLTRTATAQLTRNAQVLASREAVTEAGERAARSAAESLRLGILASLYRP